MSDESRLLGFDARYNEADCLRHPYEKEIRENFFLRSDVKRSLSVDVLVWPTHFLYTTEIRDLCVSFEPPLIEAEPCYSTGGLWQNLWQMKQRLHENGRLSELVAVELHARGNLTEFPTYWVYSEREMPTIPDDSRFLGFDIADAGFLSGLSNCGYSSEDRGRLRPQWAKRINEFGLIADRDNAFEFSAIANKRVPEHAPFWVFGLYRVV